MSFFSGPRSVERAVASPPVRTAQVEAEADQFYRDLIDRRPALLDEKLKLHARIIDEFNLVSLEKLPREDLVREVRTYLVEYMRTERLSLNQKEMLAFADEIVAGHRRKAG